MDFEAPNYRSGDLQWLQNRPLVCTVRAKRQKSPICRQREEEKVDEPVSEKKSEKEVPLDRASRLNAKLLQASTL